MLIPYPHTPLQILSYFSTFSSFPSPKNYRAYVHMPGYAPVTSICIVVINICCVPFQCYKKGFTGKRDLKLCVLYGNIKLSFVSIHSNTPTINCEMKYV